MTLNFLPLSIILTNNIPPPPLLISWELDPQFSQPGTPCQTINIFRSFLNGIIVQFDTTEKRSMVCYSLTQQLFPKGKSVSLLLGLPSIAYLYFLKNLVKRCLCFCSTNPIPINPITDALWLLPTSSSQFMTVRSRGETTTLLKFQNSNFCFWV
jgi:hypothetical protein